jgi:hypothetical protein
MERPLSRAARALFWDYNRLSPGYIVLCLIILAFLLMVPPEWLGDPMSQVR